MDDIEKIFSIAEEHSSFSLATLAVVRNISDLDRLRPIREALMDVLRRDVSGETCSLNEWQSDFMLRIDAMQASHIVEARIAEVCAPEIADPIEFAQIVADLGEEADIASGKDIFIPDLELTINGREERR